MFFFALVGLSLSGQPNIVFMHDESTDGRLYTPDAPLPIPNINALQARGVVSHFFCKAFQLVTN